MTNVIAENYKKILIRAQCTVGLTVGPKKTKTSWGRYLCMQRLFTIENTVTGGGGGGDKAVGLREAGQITAPQKIRINQRIDKAVQKLCGNI